MERGEEALLGAVSQEATGERAAISDVCETKVHEYQSCTNTKKRIREHGEELDREYIEHQ